MLRPRSTLWLIASLILTLRAASAWAAWSSAPDENLLLVPGPGEDFPRAAVADGQGGMWVVWDSNQLAAKGPHLQHVSATGEFLLGPTGLRVADFIDGDIDVLLADDGGVFVAWEDYRSASSWDIYAQRVSAGGAPQWGINGVLVSSGPDLAVAVGELGTIARSIDGGETWTDASSGLMVSLRGVALAEDRAHAVGDAETILLSTNLGVDWSVVASGIGPSLNAVDAFSASRAVAVGDGGRTWSWGGSQWTLHTQAVTTDLHGVAMADYEVAFAVGKNGRIARSDDRGATWVEQSSGVGLHLNAVSFGTVDVGTAVGNLGIVVHTLDGGITWNVQSSGTAENLLAVDFLDDQNGVANGENGEVIYTRDGGASWSAGSTPASSRYTGVDMTDADTAIAVGENGLIIKSNDGGATWTPKQGPSGVLDFLAVAAPGNVTWQYEPTLVPDGSGGVIVTWRGQESGDYEVFAQRLDASGSAVWAAPVQVTNTLDDVYDYQSVSRGGGGVVVVWIANTPGVVENEIHARALDADGNPLQAQAEVVNGYLSLKFDLNAVPDGYGGCLVGWIERRDVDFEVFGTRLDADANPLWTADGQLVTIDGEGGQLNLELAPDDTGGGYFVWDDGRGGGARNVRAQRMDAFGNHRWPGGDLAATDASTQQSFPSVAPEDFGELMVTWFDASTPGPVLRAQVVATDGSLRWPGGVALRSGLLGSVYTSVALRPVVPDGSGGLMAVWAESREGIPDEVDVYAQNVDRHGYLGLPAASIDSVVDVPQDQGGEATVTWSASYLDAVPNQVITEYSIWRSNPNVSKSLGNAMLEREQQAALRAGLDPELVAAQAATGWAFVGTTPAAYLPSYAFDAPTYGDQTPTETPVTDFQIIAHAADPFVFWTSLPASGSSVDNLAPAAPVSLLAAESAGHIELVWNDGPGSVEDVDLYRIYRGMNPSFPVGPSSFLSTSVVQNSIDPDPGTSTVFYRVSAVDVHGNESEPSDLATVESVTGVGTNTPTALRLRPAYPNPTSNTAVLRFAVPRPGPARVDLYDLAGRRVFHEELGSIGAGWHEWTFKGTDHRGRALASGTYLLRLSHASHTRAARIVLAASPGAFDGAICRLKPETVQQVGACGTLLQARIPRQAVTR